MHSHTRQLGPTSRWIITGLLALEIALASFSPTQAFAQADPDPLPPQAGYAFALQGGWWSLESELSTPWGVYLGLGIPYPAFFISTSSGRLVPLGVRLGYEFAWSSRWKLRAAGHFAAAVSSEKCYGDCTGREVYAVQLFEVGLRYEGPSGFVAGLDVPLVAFGDGQKLYFGEFGRLKAFAGPVFSQCYWGYRWHW